MKVSYSQLDTYRQCPLKWQWSYEWGYRREPKPGNPLTRGSLWHEVLETYYVNVGEGAAQAHVTAQDVLRDRPEDDDDAELIRWMLDGYHELYQGDPQWKVLELEQRKSVELPGGHELVFVIDMVVEDEQGRVWIIDHKSKSTLSQQSEIDLDDQFSLYMWAYWETTGRRPFGFIRNDARTKRNKGAMSLDQRFQRVETFRTDRYLKSVLAETVEVIKAMESKVVYSAINPQLCSWRCDFKEAHLAMRSTGGKAQNLLEDFGFEVVES